MIDPNKEPQSYIIKNLEEMNIIFSLLPSENDKRFFISFYVISDYVELLRKDKTGLATQFKDEFIKNVMIPDFNQVIAYMKVYKGKGRTKVEDARKFVQVALSKLTEALSSSDNADLRIKALKSCRDALRNAHQLFNYLIEKQRLSNYRQDIEDISQKSSIQRASINRSHLKTASTSILLPLPPERKYSNKFRYLLQKAIDLYATTHRRNFSDVLAEMDVQLGYGRNSHTIQGWLNANIVPNSAEVEYLAKKITTGIALDSEWIRNFYDAAGYEVPSYLIKRFLRVFLCHAHSDATKVRALYNRLIESEVDAWLDKEKLLPGSDWEAEIRKAVREADVVVVCLSRNFNQRGFRQKEVRLALDVAMEQPDGEIFIVPARLEECEALESLKKWHWVDLYQENGYEKLFDALKARARKVGARLK